MRGELSDAPPFWFPPPGSHTMTGSGALGAGFGVHTLRYRQSSVSLSGPWIHWGCAHSLLKSRAASTSVQGVTAAGGFHRSSPTGGFAYGMPRNRRVPPTTSPCTLPSCKSTTDVKTTGAAPSPRDPSVRDASLRPASGVGVEASCERDASELEPSGLDGAGAPLFSSDEQPSDNALTTNPSVHIVFMTIFPGDWRPAYGQPYFASGRSFHVPTRQKRSPCPGRL